MHTTFAEVATSRPKQFPRVRAATLEDYSQIAALALRYELHLKSFENWKNLWLGNPVYRQLHNWPMGWVLENEKMEVAGFIGNIPESYNLNNRTVLAAASHALVVDVPYRSHSLSLISRFYSQRNVDLFLSTTANAQASKAYEVFGARRVPLGTWDCSAFWVLNHRRFVASLLAMKDMPCAKQLTYPIAAGLFLKDGISGLFRHRSDSGIQVAESSKFDSRFETFWDELQQRRSSVLLANRTQETLKWHFGDALSENQAWILTVSDANRLLAYSVFFRQDSLRFGLKRVRLADFQWLDGDGDEFLAPMISYALTICRRERAHMLETIGLPMKQQRVIDSLRPHRRALPCWLYFYKSNDKCLAQTLARPEVWDASYFDGDSSL
jgi:hypothetical protein